jgi:hypothetical protein
VWIDKGWLVDYFGANVQTFFYFTKCVIEFFLHHFWQFGKNFIPLQKTMYGL